MPLAQGLVPCDRRFAFYEPPSARMEGRPGPRSRPRRAPVDISSGQRNSSTKDTVRCTLKPLGQPPLLNFRILNGYVTQPSTVTVTVGVVPGGAHGGEPDVTGGF